MPVAVTTGTSEVLAGKVPAHHQQRKRPGDGAPGRRPRKCDPCICPVVPSWYRYPFRPRTRTARTGVIGEHHPPTAPPRRVRPAPQLRPTRLPPVLACPRPARRAPPLPPGLRGL